MKNKNFTPVIFRKFKEGDIIALFPTVPGTYKADTCNSYQHIGQHGAASVNLVNDTSLASPEEYKDLFEELVSIGYDDLKVYSRMSRWLDDERLKELSNYK